MIRTPPRSNRTDPLFPYTTRFRSLSGSLARTPAETSLGRPYRILLVEDDRGDALLVEVALEETLPGAALIWHPTVPSETEVLSAHPDCILVDLGLPGLPGLEALRSEEHTSELQSLMRISYAVFCLKKKNERH